MPAPLPPDEEARLRALAEHRILDTAPERMFDDLVDVAAYVCQTPISLVSLIDESRQWFKAKTGLQVPETPREDAFCAHAILDSRTMVVSDAAADQRFADNPLVIGEPHIRFYAGAPLLTADGHRLGTLCVIDRKPRTLDVGQGRVLDALARQASALLQARRSIHRLALALSSVRSLQGLIPICAACKSIRNDEGYWQRVEAYITENTDAQLTHGLCPPCQALLYPDIVGPAKR